MDFGETYMGTSPAMSFKANVNCCKNTRCLVYVIFTVVTVFLVVSVWDDVLSNPIIITLEDRSHPVTSIPYPAIAVCNINKISKRKASDLATYIVNHHTGVNYTRIMQSIKFLVNLFYDSDYQPSRYPEMDYFQNVLDNLGLKIKVLMQELSTPCEDLFKTCQWKGLETNCSDLFHLRLTFDGYCCTFNYIKGTHDQSYHRSHPHRGYFGQKNGLSVVLNNDQDDYFVTGFPSIGIKILIFVPSDYPDKSSGSLTAVIANVATENYLEIIPTSLKSVEEVSNYAQNTRRCLFEKEQLTNFGVYSQSDCLVDCKIRSMMTLCQCVPFTIPWSNHDTICTLRDLPCLHKYVEKWTALVPRDNLQIKEKESALLCEQICYPACESISYEVEPSNAMILNPQLVNNTIVHIFYRDWYHDLYKQDVVYSWYEILSFFGGIFGIILGVSLISVIEFGFCCVKTVYHKILIIHNHRTN